MEILKGKNAPKILRKLSVTKYAIQKLVYFPYLCSDCFQTWQKSNIYCCKTFETILSEIPALVQNLLSLRFEKWLQKLLRDRLSWVNVTFKNSYKKKLLRYTNEIFQVSLNDDKDHFDQKFLKSENFLTSSAKILDGGFR